MNTEMRSDRSDSSGFPEFERTSDPALAGVSAEYLSRCNRQLLRLALKYIEPGMDEPEFRSHRSHLIGSVLNGDFPLVEERVTEVMVDESSLTSGSSLSGPPGSVSSRSVENPLNWIQPYVTIPPWIWALSLFVVIFTIVTWVYLTRI